MTFKKLTYPILLLVCSTLTAQTGILKGKVTNSERKPMQFVTLTINNSRINTTTNFDGSYILSNLTKGTLTITASFLGYQKLEKEITIEEGKTVNLNFELPNSNTNLDEVVVSGYSTRQKAVEDLNRMPISQLVNPQTINQIDKSVLKQQNNFNLTQTLKNVAGLVSISSSQQFAILSRGFAVSNAVNGILNLSGISDYPIPTYNVESVQVIKGPTGTIYGVGSPSGLINIVTKKPLDVTKFEIDATAGSFGQYRTMVDATGPFQKNGKLKYRFIAGNTNTATYAKAFGNTSDYFIAPQLQYDFSDKTSIAVEYNYNNNTIKQFGGSEFILSAPLVPEAEQYDANGNFIAGTRDMLFFDWEDFNFDTPKGINKNSTNLGQLRFKHKLSDNWDVKILASTSSNKSGFNQLFYNGLTLIDETLLPAVTKDNIEFAIEHSFATNKSNSLQISPYLTGKFNTGSLAHAFVIGGDYTSRKINQEFSYVPASLTFDIINLGNPVFPVVDFNNNTPDASQYWNITKQNITSGGVYLQDVIKWKQFTFLAGARLEFFDEKVISDTYDSGNLNAVDSKNSEKAISPKVGITYQPTQSSSVYASFTDGFIPNINPGAGSGGPFSPERFNQFEVGARKEFFGGKLLSSIALFNINRNNLLIADPTDLLGRRYIQINEVNSKGVELATTGKISDSFTINIGYAHNPTFAPSEINAAGVSGSFPVAPKNTFNAWINYEIKNTKLKGLAFGVGGNYVGSSNSFIPNLRNKSYNTFDSVLSYKINKFTFQINAENILDLKYSSAVFDERGSVRGTPRVFRFNLNYAF